MYLALIHAQILVRNIPINTLHVIILHPMMNSSDEFYMIEPYRMTNNIGNLLQEHIILLAHITVLHPPAAKINITIVLVNAPLVGITPRSDDINPYIVLLLNHALIAIEVDHTQMVKDTLTITTIPLLICLNNQFTTPPPQNLSSNLICITQTSLLAHKILLFPILMLMVSHLLYDLITYAFSNHLKTTLYLLN